MKQKERIDYPIPIEWIEKKMTEYVMKGRFSSDVLPIVYTLIGDWRREYENGSDIRKD